MYKNQKCIAPWHSLTIKPTGDVVPDSTYSGKLGNIRNNSFSEIWFSKKAKMLRDKHQSNLNHEGCRNCLNKFKAIGRSRKTFFDDNLKKHISVESLYNNEDPKIYYLDVNFSNKCNLKCNMCSGHVSTAWIKDEIQLQKIRKDYQRHFAPEYRKIEIDHVINFFSDENAFKNLKFVALRGGEPFLEEMNFEFLNFLIKEGISKEISLDISTNGTVFDHRLKDIFSHFKSVELYISFEGTGNLYQYIRGGDQFSFESLEHNIKKFRSLPNTTLIFAVTIMAYNILHINNIWNWYLKNKVEGDEISFSNIVVYPDYLDFRVLPKEIRELALKKLNQINYPSDNYYSGKRWIGNIGIDSLKENLLKESNFNQEKLFEHFKGYTKDLDTIRNNNILDHLSEFSPYFE